MCIQQLPLWLLYFFIQKISAASAAATCCSIPSQVLALGSVGCVPRLVSPGADTCSLILHQVAALVLQLCKCSRLPTTSPALRSPALRFGSVSGCSVRQATVPASSVLLRQLLTAAALLCCGSSIRRSLLRIGAAPLRPLSGHSLQRCAQVSQCSGISCTVLLRTVVGLRTASPLF